MGCNVERNPIGAVPNALLASTPGKELNPLILSMLLIHRGQVKIDRERFLIYHCTSSVITFSVLDF